MKRIVLIVVSFIFTFTAIADFVTLRFVVTDELDIPIKGAKISVDTARDAVNASWLGTMELRNYSVSTKDDGQAKLTIRCHDGDYNLEISAPGYYPCKMIGESCYCDVVDVRTGDRSTEMQDREYKVILRKEKKPVAMSCHSWTECRWRTPLKIGSYPFDLEVGDWVKPMGKGKMTDLIVKYEAVTNDAVLYAKGSIQFVKGGAYKRRFVGNMSFCTDYEADTKGKFVSEFPYECKADSVDLKEYIRKYPIDDNEYLVFRVREKRDEFGRLISAHYGKIYGPVRVFGQFYLEKISFNTTLNDPNLEEKR